MADCVTVPRYEQAVGLRSPKARTPLETVPILAAVAARAPVGSVAPLIGIGLVMSFMPKPVSTSTNPSLASTSNTWHTSRPP